VSPSKACWRAQTGFFGGKKSVGQRSGCGRKAGWISPARGIKVSPRRDYYWARTGFSGMLRGGTDDQRPEGERQAKARGQAAGGVIST
jgi:hypothetical protein